MSEKPKSSVRPPFLHSESELPPALAEETKPEGWLKQQLRAFDWKSAASLRAPQTPTVKADHGWNSTEWDDIPNPVGDDAQKVAEQLHAVAQKIRNGELSVSGRTPTPETAMAAALEALIRAK